MELSEFVVLLSRLATRAMATFFAILLWSQTRDVSWVLIIIGTLVSFGVVSADFFDVSGFPVLRIVLINLPLVFLSLAFISMIVRKRVP